MCTNGLCSSLWDNILIYVLLVTCKLSVRWIQNQLTKKERILPLIWTKKPHKRKRLVWSDTIIKQRKDGINPAFWWDSQNCLACENQIKLEDAIRLHLHCLSVRDCVTYHILPLETGTSLVFSHVVLHLHENLPPPVSEEISHNVGGKWNGQIKCI